MTRQWDAREGLRLAARAYVDSLIHLAPGPTITGMTLLDHEATHRALMDAAVEFAAAHDRTRFGRGYESAVQDCIERVEDNPYTTGPTAHRLAERLMPLRGASSYFRDLEEAAMALLIHVYGIPSQHRGTSFDRHAGRLGKLLSAAKGRRLFKTRRRSR
jgi:hypothetical protein